MSVVATMAYMLQKHMLAAWSGTKTPFRRQLRGLYLCWADSGVWRTKNRMKFPTTWSRHATDQTRQVEVPVLRNVSLTASANECVTGDSRRHFQEDSANLRPMPSVQVNGDLESDSDVNPR